MDCHILHALAKAIIVTTTLDLWMSHGRFDTFALVVNYIINNKWEPCHITIGIFKVHETSRTTMDLQLKDQFSHFDLCDKVITYVKDKGINLNTMSQNAWTSIISCVPLALAKLTICD